MDRTINSPLRFKEWAILTQSHSSVFESHLQNPAPPQTEQIRLLQSFKVMEDFIRTMIQPQTQPLSISFAKPSANPNKPESTNLVEALLALRPKSRPQQPKSTTLPDPSQIQRFTEKDLHFKNNVRPDRPLSATTILKAKKV